MLPVPRLSPQAAVDGRTKIGPTLPASWREQYGGLRNFRVGEFAEIRGCEGHLFVLDASFRELAAEAIRKHSRRESVRLAGALAEAIRFEDFTMWGKPGIRAQLLDTATSRLAMGLVTEDDSLHVLNAVSLAFTCALPFAEHVCDIILSNKCVAYTPSATVR